MCEDIRLAFGRCRAMTSHRGKNEGRHPVIAPVLDDALDDDADIGDAATPDANRHAGAGVNARGEASLLEPATCLRTNVGEPMVRKLLSDEEQA
jgi:hypothetical protein